jgi:inorganic pyrophosphatase
MREQIAHFFQHYKDLETNKWTRIGRWVDSASAQKIIMDSITRANHPQIRIRGKSHLQFPSVRKFLFAEYTAILSQMRVLQR